MTPDSGMHDRGNARLAPYVSVALLRRWLDLESATQGCNLAHRLEAVCLIIDLADSTRMTERFAAGGPQGAERLGDLLDDYFAAIAAAVLAEGGIVARIAGDALTALWPTDQSDVDSARSAFAAARVALAVADGRAGGLAHRISIDIGPIDLMVLGSPGERRFLLASGEPLRAMAPGRLRGEPGEIKLAAPISVLLGEDTALSASIPPKMPSPPPGLRDFAPPVVAARVEAGLRDWLAEFRWVSTVYVGLSPNGDGADIHRVFNIIQAIAARAGAAVWDVVDDDKGVVFKIIFGLPPYATEADAVGALDVARRIRTSAAESGFTVAIGVATGRAFFGEVGGADRREHIGVGPVMNYGARLMQAAGEDVLCDDATARAAGGMFALSEAFPLEVKGRLAPLQAHRLTELRDPHQPAPRDDAALAPVGREDECALVDARIDALLAGRSNPVWLEGELGAGKTRLLRHAGQRARVQGVRVVMAGGLPSEQITPLFVFRRVFAGLLTSAGEAPPDTTTLLHRVRGLLHDMGHAAQGHLLEDILPHPGQGRPIGGLSGAVRRSALRRLVTGLINRATETTPCLMLVDDLHWVDSASAQLLADVIAHCPRVLAIMAARPEQPREGESGRAELSALTAAATRVSLERLNRIATTEMIRVRLGAARLPARLADFIHARSGGLPLHAEQLALALVERGAVSIVHGRCEFKPGELTDEGAPHTLGAVITARIDRLDPVAQRVAKTASAIGLEFDLDRLIHVDPAAFDRKELSEALDRLSTADLVKPLEPGRYTFQHTITREACYALMSFKQRGPLQAVLAQVLEAEGSHVYAAELAWRWEEAGAHARAIEHRANAAAAALRSHSVADALNHAAHMARLARQTGRPLTREQQARLERIRADAFQEQARFADAGHHFRNCAVLVGMAIPRSRTALAISLLAETISHAASRMGLRRRSRNLERDRLAAHIHMRLAEHAYFANDTLAVMHGTLSSLNRAERSGSATEMTLGFAGLAVGFGVAGLAGPAGSYATRAVTSAERFGDVHDLGLAHLMASVATFPAGDWGRTADHAGEASQAFRAAGDEFRHQTSMVLNAYADLARGATGPARDALGALTVLNEYADATSVRAWSAACVGVLDIIEMADPGTAIAAIEAALGEPLNLADRLVCLGPFARLKFMAGDLTGARDAAESAMGILLGRAPSLGIGFVSIPRVVEAWIELQEPEKAVAALRAARIFAEKVRIARPMSRFAAGRLAILQGRVNVAHEEWRRGLAEAEAMGMPFEAALCREALAGA